jgi:hypothetical protein
MAWDTDMIVMLRAMIGDDTEPYTFCDNKLTDLLITAAVCVATSVDFNYTYVVDVSARTITPDPTDYNDFDFQCLVTLKAACILAKGQQRVTAAYGGVSIKDGPSSINMDGSGKLSQEYAKDACQAYQDALLAYKTGNGLSGKAIVGPYDLGVYSRSSTSGRQ